MHTAVPSQEKEAKVQYLQKMIDVVSLALKEPVPARPSKVTTKLRRAQLVLGRLWLYTPAHLCNGSRNATRRAGSSA